MASTADRSGSRQALPRPHVLYNLLRILALVVLAVTVFAAVMIWIHPSLNQAEQFLRDQRPEVELTKVRLWMTAQVLFGGLTGAAILYALALIVYYSYHTALNIRAAERRPGARGVEVDGEQMTEVAGMDRMVALLEEINENTLLAEPDRARKRVRLADSRRQRMRAEIEKLITATKWAVARSRIEELRTESPDDEDVRDLAHKLDAAVAEHREIDMMASSEQIRSYMSLGLWVKAREAAQQLALKYPGAPEAQKMQDVVRLEEEATRKDDRVRLYQEIEHLVARKHYRDARKVADTLIERYPDSPEAATLAGQMDELNRNADIETRREMEAQIIEYEKQGRHKEAYEVARLLMEQYPESPQAIALKDSIDRLRQRAEGG
jgi:tetratricopeptide (TPR) repeat protein